MGDKPEEGQPEPGGLIDLHLQRLPEANLLDFYPAFLLFGDKHIPELLLLLDCIEVIDDYSDEEVDNELAAHHHKREEESDYIYIRVLFWL
jgi:hypothetical protein